MGDPTHLQGRQEKLEVLVSMGIRAEQKAMRRQLILDKSLDLFIHQGFAGTSVRDIAKACDISPALLFHYFENKDDILVELLRFAFSGVSSAGEMLLGDMKPLEKFENITDMIFRSFKDTTQSAPMFLLVHQVMVFDSMPDKAKQIVSNDEYYFRTVDVILEGQKNGEIRTGDPVGLAVAFWSAIQGIAESAAMNPEMPIPDPRWIVSILKADK
jgi:AcrR family transcriptional regulator